VFIIRVAYLVYQHILLIWTGNCYILTVVKKANYSASIPPPRPALRDSVWIKRLIRNKTGRRVPSVTARYAPNWTSRATVFVGRASTMESSAKAGAAINAAGTAQAAPLATLIVKEEKLV
jgi:hypothetical protein